MTPRERLSCASRVKRRLYVSAFLTSLVGLIWCRHAARLPHALAQATPVSATSRNAYWAGYVASRAGGYSEVRAAWRVPAIRCPRGTRGNGIVYAWIGEGGYARGLLSPLIQAGTASDCFGGLLRYHAFYETYPGSYAQDFPISIEPGDAFTVRVHEISAGYWELTVQDLTLHERSVTSIYHNVDTTTADFIVERPTLCSTDCSQVSVPRFDPIVFTRVQVRDHTGIPACCLQKSDRLALADDATRHVLAVPAEIRGAPNSLSVLWRRSD